MQTQKCLPPSLPPTISPSVSLIPASTMYHSGSQWQSPGINQSRTQVASGTGNFVLDGCGCGEYIQQQHGLGPPLAAFLSRRQWGGIGQQRALLIVYHHHNNNILLVNAFNNSTDWAPSLPLFLSRTQWTCFVNCRPPPPHHHHNIFLKTNINTINKKPKSVLSKLNSDEILRRALLFQPPLQPDTTQITTTMILLASCFLPCIKKGKCSMNSSWVLFLGGSSDCVLNGCTTNQHLCHSPAGRVSTYYQECCATLLAPANGCVVSSYNSQNYYWWASLRWRE